MAEGRITELPQPHTTSEVICVHCGKRWIAVRPSSVLLKELECPECTNQGYVIETGQVLERWPQGETQKIK